MCGGEWYVCVWWWLLLGPLLFLSFDLEIGFVFVISGDCGGIFNATDTPQTITSLNYPNPYPPNKRCSWVISASDDYTHVRIRVTAMDLQADTNCNNDYLELRDYPMVS